MKLPSWLQSEPRPILDASPPEFVWVWKDENVPRDESGKGIPVLRVFAGGRRLASVNIQSPMRFSHEEFFDLKNRLEAIAPEGRVHIHPAHVVISSDKIGDEEVLEEAFAVTVVRIVAGAFGIVMNPEEHGVFATRFDVLKSSKAYGCRWSLPKL